MSRKGLSQVDLQKRAILKKSLHLYVLGPPFKIIVRVTMMMKINNTHSVMATNQLPLHQGRYDACARGSVGKDKNIIRKSKKLILFIRSAINYMVFRQISPENTILSLINLVFEKKNWTITIPGLLRIYNYDSKQNVINRIIKTRISLRCK